uniref:DCD domain-containing protein n=1 Tax=Calcidiscus leptoporus TaxID=127549 RepID=A0A7S0P1R7_9EUKA
MPSTFSSMVREIGGAIDRAVLFLFNFTQRKLHGVFVPDGAPGFPLEDRAWVPGAWLRSPRCAASSDEKTTPFVAQMRVKGVGEELPPLPENVFKHVMRYTAGHKFELQLSSRQVSQLILLFLKHT